MFSADQHDVCAVLARKQFQNTSRICNNSEKDPFSAGFLPLKHSSVFHIWFVLGFLSLLLGQ